MRTFVTVSALAMLVCAQGSAQSPDPTTASAWIGRARAALARASWDDAQSALEQAAAMGDAAAATDALAASWADLGDALFRRGDPTRAVSMYARALVLVPDDASYHVARGWALSARGDAGHARAEIVIARRLDPGSADARALEQHVDEAAAVQAGLFVGGGIATGVGVLLALAGALAGSVAPSSDGVVFESLIGSGCGLAVLGIVAIVLGDVLRVGSFELPRRGARPTVAWLPAGLQLSF